MAEAKVLHEIQLSTAGEPLVVGNQPAHAANAKGVAKVALTMAVTMAVTIKVCLIIVSS